MILRPALLLAAAMARPVSAAPAPFLAWPLAGVEVTATDSFKWVVRAAPDGAGGAVLAWEENRNRHLCCRDTRDLYAQRVDAAGRRVWPGEDVKVAAEEPGEEILGMAPAGRGGALLFWRRGRGTLLAQELTGEGAALDGPGGTILRDSPSPCEWPQLTGFAVTPRGARAELVWTEGELPGASAIMGEAASRAGERWLVTPPRTLLTRPGLHAAAVTACGNDRWCLVWWSCTGAGITVGGLMLGSDGAPQGTPFEIGRDPGLQYGHAEAAGTGPTGAWVLWSAVHPEHLEHTHVLHLAAITAPARGRARVAGVEPGRALSQVMFVPSTVVQVGAGAEVAATAPIVAWRQTAALAAAGVGAVVAWLDGKGLQAVGARWSGDRLVLTPPVAVSPDANAGFSPLLIALDPATVLTAWAAQAGSAVRASAQWLRWSGDRLAPAGDPLLLVEGGTRLPRVACAVRGSAGDILLAWNALGGGDHGEVVAQRVVVPPR